ncbi:MAG TPA: SDR family NAD(P)-dependent oxidoreductase, partial [Actinophytocola sp.]|nr:SDR family NAD(P)-dependent oxidoreductase [Actinophytocola sp.]
HVILEEAPEPAPPVVDDSRLRTDLVPWPVSARSAAGLLAQAGRLRDFARDHPEVDPRQVGWSLATTRAALTHRAVVLGMSNEELLAGTAALADGTGELTGTAGPGAGGLAFLFPGQGAHWAGMGRELYAASATFAATVDEVAAVVVDDLPKPLLDVLFGDTHLDTRHAQLGLFAVGVGLAAVLREFGVLPDVVLGHSVGEIAAACVAGVMSVADGARMVAARGRLMADLPTRGVMVSARIAEADLLPLLDDHPEVALAAVNGPESVVISGSRSAVEPMVDELTANGVRTRWLAVDNAFHSSAMDPVVDPFATEVAGLSLRQPVIPVISTVTGTALTAEQACSPRYWAGQVRATVRFADAAVTAADQHLAHFVELGPGAGSTSMVRQTLDAAAIPVWRSPGNEPGGLTRALAELWVRGVAVDWTPLLPATEPVDLPTYAFQRDRYWLEVERPHGSATPANWRYRVEWSPVAADPSGLSGDWLVLRPDQEPGWAADCVRALRAAGAQVREVKVGTDADRTAMAAAVAGHADLTGVVSLLAAPGDPAGFGATVAVVQGLGDAGVDAPVWVVTSGAVALADEPGDPDQLALWGLGRVAALEHPARWGGLVDLPADGPFAADLLATVLGGDTREDQVAIRGDGIHARRLREHPVDDAADWRLSGGTVLITGGTGGLGAHTARWVARHGAERLVLASRQGPHTPGAAALADELRATGVAVEVVACDVTDRNAVAALVELSGSDCPLRMVVHAAGAGQLSPLDGLTDSEAAEVIGAKVLGARHLDDCLGDRELDAFVVFSSIAGVWGGGGQSAYAAANAYLDGLVANRRARALPGTSIAWGPWAGAGMAEHADHAQFARRGLHPMAADAAIDELTRALAADDTTVVVADVDWSRFLPAFTSARPSPLLTAWHDTGTDQTEPDPALRDRLAALPRAEAEHALRDIVRTQAAAVLGFAGPADVDVDLPFLEVGFDSLTSIELRDRLIATIGMPLATTVVFDHPTPRSLTVFLTEQLSSQSEPAAGFDLVDRLDRLLDGESCAPGRRQAIASRMRKILDAWDQDDRTTADLGSASAEELFDVIRSEFHRSD